MVGLVIRIGIELGLAIALSLWAIGFWQAVKTRRYTRRCAQDQEFMDRFVQALDSENPFSQRTANLRPFEGKWALNMLLVTKTNVESLSTLRNMNLLICAAILVGSYFLGLIYLAVNVALFLFWATAGLSAPAGNTALGDILSTAQILYCWKRDDRAGYEAFLKDAWGVHKIASSLDRYAT